ncbi:hypothetical protein DPQ33_17295 [Oceanidesulfovibrio indonesiensis]|uniref:DUF433 domain-containing protein n=1 Tax=Oceanidesulfovibrio indonesiensis TaxID=54767 RepID=A0A7M3MA98_9BACT|nr:DUF433 domain-containing protein [Oceanidesulfovibrio indonesiensis]TVM14537.1 hypothetical protein DPQ33_17295 [Oceanidesulfovibrio indonesiensis]
MQLENILNKGVYTIAEASTLTGVPKKSFYNWVQSYKNFKAKYSNEQLRHFWNPDFIDFDGGILLTFRDIMEARFVNMFRKYNIPFKRIASAASYLSLELKVMSPFSSRIFETEGIKILVFNDENKTRLDTHTKQFLLPDMDFLMKPERIEAIKRDATILIDGIEYDEKGTPVLWKPCPNDFPDITIRPGLHTGKPTIDNLSVSTLVMQYELENDFQEIAKAYDTRPEFVQQAYEFSRRVIQ